MPDVSAALTRRLTALTPVGSAVGVRWSAQTGSTQDDAAALPAAALPCLLVTDHQTAGRGRLDRQWDDIAGGSLLLSLAWPMPVPVEDGWLALACGASIVARLRQLTSAAWALKWPNDIVVARPGRTPPLAKAGGVLLTRLPDRLVIGCGLTLAAPPASGGALAARTSVAAERGHQVTPRERLDLLAAIAADLCRLCTGGIPRAVLRAEVAGVLLPDGMAARVHLPGGVTRSGTTAGLAQDGALLLALADDGGDLADDGGDLADDGGDLADESGQGRRIVRISAGTLVYH